MNDQYHFLQREILTNLLFKNQLKYSDLKPNNIEGSQFTFHLKKLIAENLVAKDAEYYFLTPEGKNIANTFDSDSQKPLKQAKHSVIFCTFKKLMNTECVLLYVRKKNPFYNHQGFPTGKVMYGEDVIETAERELFEETKLKGKAKLVGIRHFKVYFPTKNNLVEDKMMYICRIDNPIGEISSNSEGEFYWIPISEIKNFIENPLPEFYEVLDVLKSFEKNITFKEIKQFPINF